MALCYCATFSQLNEPPRDNHCYLLPFSAPWMYHANIRASQPQPNSWFLLDKRSEHLVKTVLSAELGQFYSPGWCNLIRSISENKQEHKRANAHQFTQPFCASTCLVIWNNEATVQLLKSQGQVWAYSALRGACLLTWHTNWLEHQDKETRGAVGEKPETTFEGWDTYNSHLHVTPFMTKDKMGANRQCLIWKLMGRGIFFLSLKTLCSRSGVTSSLPSPAWALWLLTWLRMHDAYAAVNSWLIWLNAAMSLLLVRQKGAKAHRERAEKPERWSPSHHALKRVRHSQFMGKYVFFSTHMRWL